MEGVIMQEFDTGFAIWLIIWSIMMVCVISDV